MLGELILEHTGTTSNLRVLDAALQKREITVMGFEIFQDPTAVKPYKLIYTGVEEAVDLQAMLILTIKDDRAYIISYNAEPTKFSYYLPTLEKMIDSFQITKSVKLYFATGNLLYPI
jgi:hypothetical protein